MKLEHITIHHAMTKLIHRFTKSILLIALCCLSICLPQGLFANTFTLVTSNEIAQTGETVCVDITTRNFTEIVGMQYDINFDSGLLQFDNLSNINSNLSTLSYSELSPGTVRVLWTDFTVTDLTLADESLLFQMCFTATGLAGTSSNISFDSFSPIEVIGGVSGTELLPWMLVDGSIDIGASSASTLSLDDGAVVATTCSTLDGAITISPSGGQTPYSFLWTGPGSFASTSMNITNLVPGIYTLTVTDNTGEELFTNVYIGENSELNILGTVTDVDCGQSNGAINIVNISGGTEPYTFNWTNGATTEDIYDLALGEYIVTVTDANGCEGIQLFDVNEIEFGEIDAIVDDPACSGGLGSINLTVIGGSGSYSYNWSTGEVVEDIFNLTSGSYMVTITDVTTGCTMTRTYNIGVIANQFNYTYICDPVTDLAELIVVDWISIEENTYEWSNGEVTVDTMVSSIDGLDLGTYSVTITGNSSGCSTVLGPIDIDCTNSQSPNNCLMLNANSVSGNNGEQVCMDITTNGFSSIQGIQYTISWDPTILAYNNVQNFNLPNLSGVNFGESQATNGQLLTSWLSSAIGGENVADGTVIYQICFDLIGATGSSSAVSFTEDPLVFEVVAASGSVIGLNASNGTVNIGGPAPSLNITTICATAPGCIDASTGDVDISVTGGTTPYTFAWFNESGTVISTTEDLGAVTEEGMYTVIVTDANGEEATAFTNVIVNVPEVSVVNVTDVNCNGGIGGSIDISISGGTLPYSFAWSNGATTEDVDNLAAGEYEVTVSDQQGCMTVVTVTVVQASDLMVEGETTCPSEAGGDGSIDITVSGGVVPYLFTWSNGMPTEDISGLEDGEYVITVEDAVGCIEFISFYIGDCVWPGDTDTNGIVNNFDLLNIGLAYGATGPVRPNASISWTAQQMDNWTESTPTSMTNYKHIDTNGEGLIDDNDTLAISQNWGLTHNFMGIGSNLIDLPPSGSVVTAPFYVQPDTFVVNSTIGLPVILGDVANTIDELYGIAFSVTYDPEVVVPGTAKMTFENSWIGELNNDMITIQRTFHAEGRLDVAMVRTDGENVVDGLGQISTFFITIEDDLVEPPGFTGLLEGMETVFGIENVRIITNIEEEVLVNPAATTSTIEGISTGVNDFEENFDLQLFPNPVSDQLTINSADAWIEQVTVFDVASREIVRYDYSQAREAILETNQFGAGTYVVKIQTDKGLAVRRIVVLK